MEAQRAQRIYCRHARYAYRLPREFGMSWWFPGSSRDTEVENGHVGSGRGRGRWDAWGDYSWHIYTTTPLLFCHQSVSDSVTLDCIPALQHPPEFAQLHVHCIGDAIQPCPLSSLLLLPSIFPSIRVFSSESALQIRWPKYWSFSFSVGPSKEYSGSISFKIHLFDLLVVQGSLKSLLHHHSSKASTL